MNEDFIISCLNYEQRSKEIKQLISNGFVQVGVMYSFEICPDIYIYFDENKFQGINKNWNINNCAKKISFDELIKLLCQKKQ